MENKKTVKFQEIEAFFSDYEFSDDEIEISQCETVTNISKFVNSHLAIIKNNQNRPVDARKRLTPYWDRLLKMYKLLNLNWNQKI